MTTALLQQALRCLKDSGDVADIRLCDDIRAHLAAPQPEPVARVVGGNSPGATPWVVWIAHPQPADGSILYAAPPAAPAPAVPTISPLALRALRMADMALASWENGYAFDSHGASREAQRLVTEALAQSAAPAVPLTDADLDRIADAVPVDDIGVHTPTWHQRFARAVLSAAPAVPPGMALVPINELSRLRKHAGFNVVELAYEQRESPGPFVGLAGTTNVMFAEQAHGIGGGNG